jgi:hypothetical protein
MASDGAVADSAAVLCHTGMSLSQSVIDNEFRQLKRSVESYDVQPRPFDTYAKMASARQELGAIDAALTAFLTVATADYATPFSASQTPTPTSRRPSRSRLRTSRRS